MFLSKDVKHNYKKEEQEEKRTRRRRKPETRRAGEGKKVRTQQKKGR